MLFCAVSPEIIFRPQDTSAKRGTTASLKCTAVGIPAPTVEWFTGTQLFGRGNTLSIANVNTTSATVYTCGASNSAGKTTASARLVVFGKFCYECNNVTGKLCFFSSMILIRV